MTKKHVRLSSFANAIPTARRDSRLARLVLALVMAILPTSVYSQSFFSLSGSIQDPSETLQIRVRRDAMALNEPFSLRTWHYNGGVNAAGDTIAAGSFDPQLDLWDPNGSLTVSIDDIDYASGVWDAEITDQDLTTGNTVGDYTLEMSVVGSLPASSAPFAVDLVGPGDEFRLREVTGSARLESIKFGSEAFGETAYYSLLPGDSVEFSDTIHVAQRGTALLSLDEATVHTGTLYSGWSGFGITSVLNGSLLSTENIAAVAWDSQSSGSLLRVTGNDARLEVGTDLLVGDGATGYFDVLDGATATVGNNAYLGRYDAQGDGEILIESQGSMLDIRGDLFIGGDGASRVGSGSVVVRGGGQVSVGDDESFSGGHVMVYGGGHGSLTVESGGMLVADTLQLDDGTGLQTAQGSTIRVNRLVGFGNHSSFNGNFELGTPNGPNAGSLDVGPDNWLEVGGDFVVGADWAANLTINRGTVDTHGDAYVGRRADGIVDVNGTTVPGEGTAAWAVDGAIYVAGDALGGATSSGELDVRNGGWVVSPERLHVGENGVVSIDSDSFVNVGMHGAANNRGRLVVGTDGTLSGSGRITATVNNHAGVVEPGPYSVFDPTGTLTIQGDYIQDASGTYSVDVGTGSDRLAITGQATLAGTLDVDYFSSASLLVGDRFEILSAASGVVGTFSAIQLPTVNHLVAQLLYHETSVELLLLLSGDFDMDGIVDGDDFLVWQGNFGMTSGALTTDGDADGDGDVDGDDFLAWQAAFGSSGGTASQSRIPEPGAVGLALVVLAGCGSARFRRA